MHIDVKFTSWKRFYFPDNIEIPEFKSENEVEEFIADNMTECENLFGCEYDMTVEGNDGESTVEVWDDNDEIIWENGK